MKNKDILKIIKSDVEKNTPNILSLININEIEIEENEEIIKSKSRISFFPKLVFPLTTLILALSLFFVLFNKNEDIPINVFVTEKDNIVANYTTKAMSMIETNTSTNLKLSTKQTKDNDKITDFHQYISILEESLDLVENNVLIIKNTDNNYQYKMIIESKSFFGNIKSYILYYNENREIDDDEEEKNMEGIILYEGVTFNFRSEQEIESDEEEINLIIYNDSGYKMIIEKEIETSESEYEYKIYQNDKLVKTIKVETNDETIELEIETNNDKLEYFVKWESELLFIIEFNDDIFQLKINLKNRSYLYTIDGEEIVKN